jgi:hypothetical protein
MAQPLMAGPLAIPDIHVAERGGAVACVLEEDGCCWQHLRSSGSAPQGFQAEVRVMEELLALKVQMMMAIEGRLSTACEEVRD